MSAGWPSRSDRGCDRQQPGYRFGRRRPERGEGVDDIGVYVDAIVDQRQRPGEIGCQANTLAAQRGQGEGGVGARRRHSRLQTRSAQRETAESANVQAKQVVQATQIVRTTPKPAKPATNPALVAVAGFVRREIEQAVTPVRTAESFTPTATVTQSVTTQATSPLGTPEQLAAEQTAPKPPTRCRCS